MGTRIVKLGKSVKSAWSAIWKPLFNGSIWSLNGNPTQPYPRTTYENQNELVVREVGVQREVPQKSARRQLRLIEPTNAAGFIGLGKALALGQVRSCRDIKVRKLRESKFYD